MLLQSCVESTVLCMYVSSNLKINVEFALKSKFYEHFLSLNYTTGLNC
jgi:hypothetical protein